LAKSKETAKIVEEETPVQPGAEPVTESGPETEAGAGETPGIDALAEAVQKADEYYAALQRMKAEFDNFRKRTQKEKDDIGKYGAEKLVTQLLPVLDNFSRALTSARNTQDFAALQQGVEMIYNQLSKVLENEGLTPIIAVGQPFDPNLHEALLREESAAEENIVLEELEKGYYLKDKVLRPSRVKVSA
jgi:molecular chaperone GrpE